jgi:internalin A
MASGASTIQTKDGVVSTDPADFGQAIETARRIRAKGLWIRPDFEDKNPEAPVADLSLLRAVPQLEDFGIAEFSPKRITNFDAVYGLTKLTKLALHTFTSLDLSRFPGLETLFVTDAPGLSGIETLSELRFAWISKLRADDLSFLADMRQLSELRIIQAAAKRLHGLGTSPSLSVLDISHCAKLEAIDALPKALTSLKIKKCSHVKDLTFLKGHPTLEFLYIDNMPDVAFVPGLRRLSYIGFENVVDGNLTPLLDSKSLRDVGFYPAKRKNYSHSEGEVKQILGARKR